MWASFGNLAIVPWILFAQISPNMSAVPAITGAQSSSKVTVEQATGATASEHVGGFPLASSTVSRVPQAILATDTGEPLCMVRSSAPCREKVGA
jgi:hypothetical protein